MVHGPLVYMDMYVCMYVCIIYIGCSILTTLFHLSSLSSLAHMNPNNPIPHSPLSKDHDHGRQNKEISASAEDYMTGLCFILIQLDNFYPGKEKDLWITPNSPNNPNNPNNPCEK